MVDAEGNPGFLLSSGLPFYTISKPYGMAAGEVDRETVFLLVFHENRPVIREWDIDYYFPKTRVPDENAPVTSQSGKAAPKPAPRPRIQLPPRHPGRQVPVASQDAERRKEPQGGFGGHGPDCGTTERARSRITGGISLPLRANCFGRRFPAGRH